jgi:hypothetical protein
MEVGHSFTLKECPLDKSYPQVVIQAMENITSSLFGSAMWYFFQSRVFSEYPDEASAIQFNILNYIYGCMALIIMFAMAFLYKQMSRSWNFLLPPVDQSISLFKLAGFKWIHLIYTTSNLMVSACLSLLVFDLYAPLERFPRYPLNLYKFPTELEVNAPGILYFQSAAALGGIPTSPLMAYYLPSLLGSIGSSMISLCILDYFVRSSKVITIQRKYVYVTLIIFGAVSIGAAWLPIIWTSLHLVVLGILSVVLSLLLLLLYSSGLI